jgi:hypothetical protein
MVGKSKNRRRAAESLYNFPQLLQLLINVNRSAAIRIKEMEIVSFLLIAAGNHCLLSYGLRGVIWAFPSGFPTSFMNCQKLSNSLWAFPSSFPISFQLCPAAVKCPVAFKSISHRLLAKTNQFLSIFLVATFLFINMKIKGKQKYF